uniref:Uncharacterized protein n=1 Tax=Anabas testudineus TaxID=64144 RepID=A0A7N6FAI2_ANATE
SPQISLQRPFLWFGQPYNHIYVNNNGHLTFTAPLSSFPLQMFPINGSLDIIAPFSADLDNRQNGQIYYDQFTDGSVVQRAAQDINTYFPTLNIDVNYVFVATWYQVAYSSTSGTQTTFQAVLISANKYSFVLMNYGSIAATTRSDSVFSLGSNVNLSGRWAFRTGEKGCEYFQLGDSFWTDSTCAQKCTCSASGLHCHNQPCSFSKICQKTSSHFFCQTVQRRTCTISGDPHYYTFDKALFHFQGTCTYVLSEQCGLELPYYRVEGKNEHRGSTRVAWTRLVKLYVYGETIELVKGRPGEAKVNGTFAATPISLRNSRVQVYQSGFSVVVSTDFGLQVSYDNYHHVRISVPNTYQNATCGLCGNFNNDHSDDFRTRQGAVVSSDVGFANSWKTSGHDEDKDDDDHECGVHCEGLSCAACTEDQSALYNNADHCGILLSNSGPFAVCHQQLPPQSFVESCVYDLCVGGGYQPILCQALNVYASQCQQNGIQLPNWRRQGFCEIICPANSHFEPQGSGCPATCINPNSTQNCPLPAQESCICDSGYILSGGVCVPEAECGCSFEDRYYRSGETVILGDDCGRRCSCSHGSMTCQSYGCGPLETCSVEQGERGCRPNSYATCWISGPGSYHTFDGVTYQYPGACRLTLAKVMESSPRSHFMVTVEKDPRGQQGFVKVLNVEVEGTHVSIEMTESSTVHVSNLINLSQFTPLSLNHTVFPHFVRVTAPGIYNGSLGGLCGDYNGQPDDDYRTPDGTAVSSSQDFGDSWRDGPLSADCVDSGNSNSSGNSSEQCGILVSPHGPFTQCWATVDPQQYMEACREVIRASMNPASALCEFLRDYVLICQQRGVPLRDWRNATDCEPTCPLNSHYEICGSSCPSTCPSLSFPFTCDTVCQEGCQCNDGLVLNGHQCVPPTSCGCYHQGRYHEGGEQFLDGEECQHLCTCDGTTGLVQCVPNSCGPQESCRVVGGEVGCYSNPPGTCYASGDPHYYTFDHKAYDFQGTCRYVLATVCNATDELHQFSVEAKNEQLSGLSVSITAEIFVNVYGYQIHVSRDNRGIVEVNGITKNLPVSLNGSLVSVSASGSHTVISTDFDLSVSYDGWSTVSISVPSNYREKTCGLCGNFNGNSNDDFLTPTGQIVTTPDEFGTAWKVAGNYTCSDGCGSSCHHCSNEQPARAQCQVLQAADGPFSFCHEQVDPTPYFNDCVFDVCVSGSRSQDLLCRAMQAYVSACQSANVRIYPWRQNTTCIIDCPVNSHYELCGTDCGHTCASTGNANCEQVCSEGCFCNEGFRRSGRSCVPVHSCGCQHDGSYYNFFFNSCSQRCECHGPNDLRCSAISCTAAQQCTIRNGQLGCFNTISTCTVWGDPHYITFDGALAHFQGTCSYIITESVSHDISETQFQVAATNNHRGNNAVSFVNGSEVSVPTTAGTLASIVRQGSYIMVDATDLTVQFDGQSTLLVRIGENHRNKVTGMCGNFNDNPEDDKVFPNGTLAQNDFQFGNSWKANTSQNNCRFREEYSELCSIITNTSGPFAACHQHSNPEPFFSSCVYDLCLYTPANNMLCSAVSAYERTCSFNLHHLSRPFIAESDPCESLNCTDYEWCGQKDGVYGCFCDEHYPRPNNRSYGEDSSIACASSSGTLSVSRCQLFEAGFDFRALHLRDDSCRGTVQDGRLLFHFDNDNQLCVHILYQLYFLHNCVTLINVMSFSSVLTLYVALCSVVRKKLPCGSGQYHLRMIPYQDPDFHVPLTSNSTIHVEIGQLLFMEVQAEGVDESQISTILESCWATPVNDADYPTRSDLISAQCPNQEDGTVELVQNGISTVARFSFRMFNFTNFSSIYLHCQVHLCLLTSVNAIDVVFLQHCYPGDHGRVRRDVSYHDTTAISLGPLVSRSKRAGKALYPFNKLCILLLYDR